MQLDLLGFHRAIAGEMAITREERMEKKKKRKMARQLREEARTEAATDFWEIIGELLEIDTIVCR